MNQTTDTFSETDLSPVDRHFARFICRLAATADDGLLRAAALLSRAVGEGDVCLDLAGVQAEEGDASAGRRSVRLRESGVVGRPGEFAPLILDDSGRLYLYRYWRYESELARIILAKGAGHEPLDEAALAAALGRLFPATPAGETDWQRVAAVAAVRSRFCVISGGPGTGKTSTVVKIIALLIGQAGGRKLRVALAAPTGKAATRLQESIRGAKEGLGLPPEVAAGIPDVVATIHRLLGAVRDSARFRHDAGNPLPHDVVVVDEASMVAMPLMAKLAGALRRDARLILLGDRDQLASVEAGAVLGDICAAGRGDLFSSGFAAVVERVAGERLAVTPGEAPPLADSLVVLEKNYRFGAGSGIGRVSRLVNAGEGGEALALLKEEAGGTLAWRAVPPPDLLERSLAPAVIAGFTACLRAESAAEALSLFNGFRILCALRQGAYGALELNGLVERILAGRGLISPQGRWYRGRPVMVTANDYGLKLFNGDVGIILPDPESDGALRAFFPSPEGGGRRVSPLRLPAHETAFAMTVHKSQGSEFERVLVILPERDSAILTRELLYTALTRARSRVELWGSEEVVRQCVERRVRRSSGLREALWG